MEKPTPVKANMDKMRVMKEPVLVDGRFICRVVGDYDRGRPGSGMWVEGWTGSEWRADAEDLPSMNKVFESPPAPREILEEAAVPDEPFPKNYQPHEIDLPWLEQW